MAYETKVILTLLADKVGTSKSIPEAYNSIVKAASVEGLKLPTYKEFIKEKEREQKENSEPPL